jgi:glycosyltransferase involved in cell wall biosynthesis
VIGVVIPCRDGERYLGEAIESVRAQSAPVAAIVVADDGSRDGSAAVARDRGARVVHTAVPGSGAAAARRAGIAALDAPLLAFLDCDDRWVPDKLERQLAALAEDPGLDGVVGGVRNFYTPGREAELQDRLALPPDLAAAYAWSALLVRREALASLDWEGITGKGETPEFFRLARARLRFGAVPGVVFERRIHGGNLTVMDRAALQADYLRVAREAILAHRRSS